MVPPTTSSYDGGAGCGGLAAAGGDGAHTAGFSVPHISHAVMNALLVKVHAKQAHGVCVLPLLGAAEEAGAADVCAAARASDGAAAPQMAHLFMPTTFSSVHAAHFHVVLDMVAQTTAEQ